jgi:hypothetical protein
VLNPAIRSVYYGRATWTSLARQYREYGYWKIKVMRKHPRQARARHFAPAALAGGMVVTGIASVLGSPIGRLAFGAGTASYIIANLASAVRATRAAPELTLGVCAAYATIHFSYGTGFLMGLGAELAQQLSDRAQMPVSQGEQRDR